MSMVYDSNVFIYQLNGVLGNYGQSLLRQGFIEGGVYSIISKIEILGFAQPPDALAAASRMLEALNQIDLN